jgi:hypothetical protein
MHSEVGFCFYTPSANSRRAPLPWSELTRSRLAGYAPLDDDTFLLLNERVDQLAKLIRDEINAMRLNQ